jgi:hypothetical protein
MQTYVPFVFAYKIKSPQKRSLGVKWYQKVTIDEEVQTLCERAIILCFAYIGCNVTTSSPTILSTGS